MKKYLTIPKKKIFYDEIYSVLNKYATINLSKYVTNEYVIFEDITITKYLLSALENSENKLELTNAIKNKVIIISNSQNEINESLKMIDIMMSAIDKEIEKLQYIILNLCKVFNTKKKNPIQFVSGFKL